MRQAYDEIWDSSALTRQFYINRFGCRPAQVQVTGHGRTDRLVRQDEDRAALRRALGEPPAPTRLVLFAPTWHHGRGGQSVFPFGVGPERFLDVIGDAALAVGIRNSYFVAESCGLRMIQV